MRAIILAGSSVSLVTMTAEDQPFFQKWLAESEELRSLIDDPSVPTAEGQMKWFERSKQPDRKLFSIVTNIEQELLGNGGLVHIDPAQKSATLRITLGNPDARGKGYGSEATQFILRYAFETIGLKTISLEVLADNARAIRAYEKAGFKQVSRGTSAVTQKPTVSMEVQCGAAPNQAAPIQRGDLPCSALSYVRNGGPLFGKSVRSVLFCREHVVLDGGSTDGTLEVAQGYGCRVSRQDPRFLSSDGRIIDFGGIANQAYAETTQEWILLIAADEELGAEMTQSIIGLIRSGKKGAFYMDRFFVLDGRPMLYASTNPSRQIRLCHRSTLLGFRKPVHERPVLAPGVVPQFLTGGFQYVPLTETPAAFKVKYLRYLDLEEPSFASFGWLKWLTYSSKRLVIMGGLVWRMVMLRLQHGLRDCLPVRYDMLTVWYSWQLIKRSCPLYAKNKPD